MKQFQEKNHTLSLKKDQLIKKKKPRFDLSPFLTKAIL
jgi:hypothetical protein